MPVGVLQVISGLCICNLAAIDKIPCTWCYLCCCSSHLVSGSCLCHNIATISVSRTGGWPPSMWRTRSLYFAIFVQILQGLFRLLQRTKEEKTRPFLMTNYLGTSMLHHLGSVDWRRMTNKSGVKFTKFQAQKCKMPAQKFQLAQLSTLQCMTHYIYISGHSSIHKPSQSFWVSLLAGHCSLPHCTTMQWNYTALSLQTAKCKAESRSALRITLDEVFLGVLGYSGKGFSRLHKAHVCVYLHAMLPLHFHLRRLICIIVHRSALFCTLASVQPQVHTGSEEHRKCACYETMDRLKVSEAKSCQVFLLQPSMACKETGLH